MGDLNLYFPQWQGAGETKTLYTGAAAARKGLNLKERLTEIKLIAGDKLTEENDIVGYRSILEQLQRVKNLINEKEPRSIFTLGGGCDVELAPISYLNHIYEGDLSIIWLGAHANLVAAKGSKNKQFQGMTLRTLLGEGEAGLDAELYSKIRPQQVFLLGVSEPEESEKEYIEKNNLAWLPPEKLIWSDPRSWMEAISGHVYIHIALDILSPDTFPHVLCPAEHGLYVEQLMGIINCLEEEKHIAGLSLLGYAGTDPEPMEAFKKIAALGLWI